MLAPLVKACSLNPGAQLVVSPRFDRIDRLREDLSMVLATLTVEDAEASYQAIRLSGAGGMGKAPQADISEKPTITLLKAMALAQDRDSIAREYVSRYAITFEIGYPALEEAFGAVGRLAPAIVQSFLTVLSQAPDTLIARKCGREKAEEVSRWAGEVLRAGGVYSEQGRAAIVDFDRALRDETHTLNPGTTADLISAAIFLHLYCRNRQGAYV
jgi:triphosphoribosyl-dephospho-CoA synthase